MYFILNFSKGTKCWRAVQQLPEQPFWRLFGAKAQTEV
jgi:hypothetical protein